MELKLFGDKVLFRPIIEEEKKEEEFSAGGIALPSSVVEQKKQQQRTHTATITHVGKECKDLQVGSIIYYDAYSVAGFVHNGEELLIARESDIIGELITE